MTKIIQKLLDEHNSLIYFSARIEQFSFKFVGSSTKSVGFPTKIVGFPTNFDECYESKKNIYWNFADYG